MRKHLMIIKKFSMMSINNRANKPKIHKLSKTPSLANQYFEYWKADARKAFSRNSLFINMIPCLIAFLYVGIQLFFNPLMYIPTKDVSLNGSNFHLMFMTLLSTVIFYILLQRIWITTRERGRIDENRVAYIRFNRNVVGVTKLINDTIMTMLVNAIVVLGLVILFALREPHISFSSMKTNLSAHDVVPLILLCLLAGPIYFFISYNTQIFIAILYVMFPRLNIKTLQTSGAFFGSLFAVFAIIMIYFIMFDSPTKYINFFHHHQELFLFIPGLNIPYIGYIFTFEARYYFGVLIPLLYILLYFLVTYKFMFKRVKKYLLVV